MISLEVISAYENKFVKVKSSRYAVETAIGLSKENRTETWEKMVNPYREIIDRYNEIERFKRSMAKSKLTEEDIEEISDKINTSMWEYHIEEDYGEIDDVHFLSPELNTEERRKLIRP